MSRSAHPNPAFLSWTGAARLARAGALAVAAAALTGCAGTLLVDNQVESFASWGAGDTAAAPAVPAAPQRYRFERLPSQTEGRSARAQNELEDLTREALAKQGWTAAEPGAEAPWQVQVSAQTQRLPRAPWEESWGPRWGGYWGDPWRYGSGVSVFASRGYYVGAGGSVFWAPVFMQMNSPYYQRELALVIRNATTGRVAYETRAAHDGRWNSTPALWGAMLDAALKDFPSPPNGPRRVDIEVNR